MPDTSQSARKNTTGNPVVVYRSSPEGRRPPNNLPLELSSFVGRAREVAEVEAMLSGHRLLTLTGPGGSGKTRLAMAVAWEVLDGYGDGSWLVDLTPLSDPDLVPQALASVLGVRETPGSPLMEMLSDHLRSRTILLLLDNCEHLVGACAPLAETLLRRCPNLRVLATSREALGVSGEAIFAVPPLSLPDSRHPPTAEGLSGYEAARLFVERARAVRLGFALTEENTPAVAQVCNRLDGIPLAIELAAARARALSVEQISERLDDSFRLLTGGNRSALARQRTLRATMDWSHDLLSEDERTVFRRLSVFAGGWTLEAAETVCAYEVIEEDAVLDLLASLVDKSLVLVTEQPDGEARYRLLETVRQYGQERLEASDEENAARGRHASWFLALAEKSGPLMMGRDQVGWLERTWREQHNFRTAMRYFLDREDADRAIRLTWAFWRYWWVTGLQGEARRWMEEVLEGEDLPGDDAYPERRAQANLIFGTYAWSEGDLTSALPALGEGLRLSRQTGDARAQAIGMMLLGLVDVAEGNAQRSHERFEESLRLFRVSGEGWGEAHTLAYLGLAPLLNGEPELARRCFEEGLAAAGVAGDRVAAHQALYKLGLLALRQSDVDRADEYFRKGLALADEVRDRINAPYFVKGLGQVAGLRGQAAFAVRLLGAADTALRATGSAPYRYIPDQALQDRIFSEAREALGEAAFDEEWRRGRAMTLERATGYALEEPEASQGVPAEAAQAFPAGLSAREVDVLRLVARGMTNARIAQELYISPRTVNAHMGSVYHKIGSHSRAEAARFAQEHGVLRREDP